MYKLNNNTFTRISLAETDGINVKEVIYPGFFLKYPKTFIYEIAYVISVHKKL